jgi:hypothetical protein
MELSFWQKRFTVIPSDAPTAWKNRGRYVCDGTNDQVEINAAITDAFNTSGTAEGGFVQLCPGTYTIAHPGVTMLGRTILRGAGAATVLSGTGTWSTRSGLITLSDDDDSERWLVEGFMLRGNNIANCDGVYVKIDIGGGGGNFTGDGDVDAAGRIDLIWIWNTDYGVHIDSIGTNGDAQAILTSRVRIRNTRSSGIRSNVADNHFHMVDVGGCSDANPGAGIEILQANNKISNSKFWYTTRASGSSADWHGAGMRIGSAGNHISNVICQENQGHGAILVNASGQFGARTKIDIVAHANSRGNEGVYDGFHAASGAHHFVADVVSHSAGADGRHRAGVGLIAPTDFLVRIVSDKGLTGDADVDDVFISGTPHRGAIQAASADGYSLTTYPT